MKIVIITDSLGCPRNEIKVKDTWVYKFLNQYGNNNVIYTFIKPGLTTNMIDYGTIKQVKPDLIIMQVGIVDCCRRVSKESFRVIINAIPILGNIWRNFASKNHYVLTRLFEIHKVPYAKFKINVEKLKEMNDEATIAFIRIADAGSVMIEKTYNVEKDIALYNGILKSVGDYFIDPYNGYIPQYYILAHDGHHLNKTGHSIVFDSLENLLNSDKIKVKSARN